ncbi:hypothetical protein D9757_010043 [Collybiopsis confluens]|uniref:Uncharacterized protein n=1 Tax=Collybiopsis confluens TaxID=2823264 RepID=A0A8H5LTV1_9AGAR|nr:hypothetical protein D9757_010043 [Collybiopsis confluens]
MKDDYVETSDKEEKEESRGLFYAFGPRGIVRHPSRSEPARAMKRVKTSHEFQSEQSSQYDVYSFSHHLRAPSSEWHAHSQTPETEPPPSLFDETVASANSPLTFPGSDLDTQEEGDGLQDCEMSQDPLDFLGHPEQASLSPLPPSSIPPDAKDPSEDLPHFDESTLPSQSSAENMVEIEEALPDQNELCTQDSTRITGIPGLSPSTRAHSHSASASPQPQASHSDLDAAFAQSLGPRSLRQKSAKQRNPYTFDHRQYAKLMEGNPEAMVKTRHIEREPRRRERYLSEAESSQEQEFRPPSDDEEESQPFAPNSGNGAALVPDLPESSEDEELSEARREAKKTDKEKKRAERETKRAEKEKENPRSTARELPSEKTRQRTREEGSLHIPRNAIPRPSGRLGNHDTSGSPPHAGNVGAMGCNLNDSGPEPVPSCSSSTSQGTPVSARQSPINDRATPEISSDSGSESENVKSRLRKKKQIKVLERMFPKFMLTSFGLRTMTDARQQKDKGKQLQSSLADSGDEDGSLRPGQARIRLRKGARPPGVIRGDTESESESDEGEMPHPSVSYDHRPWMDSVLEPSPAGKNTLAYVRRPHKSIEIVEVSSSSSSSECSSDETEVDDKEIAIFLDKDQSHYSGSPSPRETLIDYMLARNVLFGSSWENRKNGKRTRRGQGHSKSSVLNSSDLSGTKSPPSALTSKPLSRPQPAVSAAHHLVEIRPDRTIRRETPLSSQRHHSSGANGSRGPRFRTYGYGKTESTGVDGEYAQTYDSDPSDERLKSNALLLKKSKKSSFNRERRRRKEQQRLHGVYINSAEPGTRIVATTGGYAPNEQHHASRRTRNVWRRRSRKGLLYQALMLDNDDLELRKALTPQKYSPVATRALKPEPLPRVDGFSPQDLTAERANRRIDSGAEYALLARGRNFGLHTFIGRGLLFELMRSRYPNFTMPPQEIRRRADRARLFHQTPRHTLLFSLSKPLPDFLRDLPLFYQVLADHVTGLPDADDEDGVHAWRAIMTAVLDVAVSFLQGQGEGVAVTEELVIGIREVVQKGSDQMVVQMLDAGFRQSAIDMMTLEVCWFAVELAATVGASDSLERACKLLIHCLLELDPGIAAAMKLLKDPSSTLNDRTSIVQRTAELWICLIHLLKPQGDATDPSHAQPLWGIVEAELKRRDISTEWTVLSNNIIWGTIFNLCALSQFSEVGHSGEKPKLVQYWPTVQFALQRVKFDVDLDTDQHLPSEVVEQRDLYIGLLVARCFLLATRWGWALDSAWEVLKYLLKGFSSRKFMDLQHEKCDFPGFIRTQSWDSCHTFSLRDTAFVLLLKLVVLRGDTIKRSGTENQLKKLVALINPTSAVPFSRTKLTQGNELSMLYNRTAATAVSLHLLPSDYRSKVQQARNYVDFERSDDTARIICIRGMMYLAQIMVMEKLDLGDTELRDWYKGIIDGLIAEHKSNKENEQTYGRLNRVRMLVTVVLGSLRHILNAYNASGLDAQYPDASLLDGVQRISNIADLMADSQIAHQIEMVLRAFFQIREKAVPLPPRPLWEPFPDKETELNESQDSQDTYGCLDINFDDPNVDAMLSGDMVQRVSTDVMKINDQRLVKALGPLAWALYRRMSSHFSQYSKSQMKPSTVFMEAADSWIDTWISCVALCVLYHDRGATWSNRCLNHRQIWKEIDLCWRRRIDMRVAFRTLTENPMAYSDDTLKAFFIESLFDALVPGPITKEHEFVALLFCIDGLRHPLLKGILPFPSKTFVLTADELRVKQEEFLGCILDNVEESLRQEENTSGNRIFLGESVENKRYGDLISRYLSKLKDMCLYLPQGSEEQRKCMLRWPKIVFQVVNPTLMSPAHPHTVTIVAEDDDDNDICPVCDGQCTCNIYQNNSPQSLPPPSPARDPPKPVLKIKLPAALLKRNPPPPTSQPLPKRRGRPPKNPAIRAAITPTPSTSTYQHQRSKPAATSSRRKPAVAVKDGGVRKKTIRKRKRVHSSDESSSDLTDIDHLSDDDSRSAKFPTFVSATSSNSSASSSDSGSLSGFETDSSIEAEEENFILAEERARVRRELLHGGGGEESLQKRRDNNWVIRPRQMSVGAPSDIDMDGDSDATQDADDDDEDDDEGQGDDEEPDGDDTEDTDIRHFGSSGLITAWSDDEASSFDADLFFANLSEHESRSSGSSTQSEDGQEGDYSDVDVAETAANLIPHLRQGVGIGVPNLAFELTEGWDGQVLFTNGLLESSSNFLETPFLPPGPDPSPSPGPDGDVDMLSTDAGDADEEGYEQDVDLDTAEAEGDGDTTDEELVGEDDLPNERAMRLFNTPFSFTAINPLSTMSPVSRSTSFRLDSIFGPDSPRPSDILAHRIQGRASDLEEQFDRDLDEEDSPTTRERKEKDKAARGGMPRTGLFEIPLQTRQAVIDGEQKHIPSSFPSFIGRRRRGAKSMSFSFTHGSTGSHSMSPQSFSTSLRPSSLPPPSSRLSFSTSYSHPLSPSNEILEETTMTSNVSIRSPPLDSVSQSGEPATESILIELDDVLDSSLLVGAEPSECTTIDEPVASSSSMTLDAPETDASTGQFDIQNLNRWDVISVGALRKAGVLSDSAATSWGSDSGPDYAAYSNVMKSSPLTTMLWHNRNGAAKQPAQRSMDYVMSPEFGPIKDGERTPTSAGPSSAGPPHHYDDSSPRFDLRNRKEQKKDRKVKRKNHGSANPSSNHNHHPKQHHHHHAHHPNSKFRSTSSSQRMNFFSSPVPPLSI